MSLHPLPDLEHPLLAPAHAFALLLAKGNIGLASDEARAETVLGEPPELFAHELGTLLDEFLLK